MKIRISDGMGHMSETVTLDSAGVHGSDWVVGILQRAGCRVDESMPRQEIEAEVYSAFCDGYDGDPKANGLAVRVIEE